MIKPNVNKIQSYLFVIIGGLILTGINISAIAQDRAVHNTIDVDKHFEEAVEEETELISNNPPPVAYVPVEFGPDWAEAIWGGATYPSYQLQWGPSLPLDSWITHPVNGQNYLIEFPSGWTSIYYRVKGVTEDDDETAWSNTVELTLP